MENFETGTLEDMGWTDKTAPIPTYPAYPELSTENAYSGTTSLRCTGFGMKVKSFDTQQNGIVSMMFYDDAANQSAYTRVVGEAWDGTTRCMIGMYYTGFEWNTSSKTNYMYRIGDTWTKSSVARTTGWHELTFDFTSGTNVVLSIDGTVIGTAASLNTFSEIRLGSDWSAGGVGFDAFYFDDIKVNTETPAITAVPLTVEVKIETDAHTVTYYPNGGSGSEYVMTARDASPHTVYAPTDGALNYAKEGFHFDGWNTQADGGGTRYSPGSILTLTDGDVTLYAAWAMSFTDVNENDWFYAAVYYVYGEGLVQGTSAKTFSPDTIMTREMFVTILARLEERAGVNISGYTNPFDDVESGRWYTDAISWACAEGLVKGCDSNTFGLGDPVTREQMAVLLVRYSDYKGITLGSGSGVAYADASSISGWAQDGVEAATDGGLFVGEDGYFHPQRSSTRAEAIQAFSRFMQMYMD